MVSPSVVLLALGFSVASVGCRTDPGEPPSPAPDPTASVARSPAVPEAEAIEGGGTPEDASPPAAAHVADDAGDALPPDVVAVLVRATHGLDDCVQITPLGGLVTTVLDVSFHLAAEGRITSAHVDHANHYCAEIVVVRRLESLRFPPHDRDYDARYRFVVVGRH
jgi:hypothetical protein